MREIRGRRRIVGTFSDVKSVLMLVALPGYRMLLPQLWKTLRYMNIERLKELER